MTCSALSASRPTLPYIALAMNDELRILHVRGARPIACGTLAAPVGWLRWAADRLLLLAADASGTITILRQPRNDDSQLQPTVVFSSPERSLRAVKWLSNLPLGVEGFLTLHDNGLITAQLPCSIWRRGST